MPINAIHHRLCLATETANGGEADPAPAELTETKPETAATPGKSGGMFASLKSRLTRAGDGEAPPTETAGAPTASSVTPEPTAAPTQETVDKLVSLVISCSRRQLISCLIVRGFQQHKLQGYKQRLETAIKAQKDLQKQNEKLENQLAAQQDQSMQRVAELKEAYKLDQQAKAHLAGAFQVP